MKKRLMYGLVVMAALTLYVPQAFNFIITKASVIHSHIQDRQDRQERGRNWDEDYKERDEISQSYQLTAGARVEVRGINGGVEIETTSGSTAEIHIVRMARTREDLEYHKIIIEPTPNSLVIRGEDDKERRREGRNRQVNHRVTLKLPRQIDLTTSGVNGAVRVGEVDGPVKVSGVNGRVEVAQAMGYTTLSGINGRVSMTIARLGEQGIKVSGINGGVELNFTDELNADLNVTGINGNVDSENFPLTMQGKIEPHNFRAKIGSGGSPITVSGVNGKVKLGRAAR